MSYRADSSHSGDQRSESTLIHALVAIAQQHGIEARYHDILRRYALPPGEPETRIVLAIAQDLGLRAKAVHVRYQDLTRFEGALPALMRVDGGGALLLRSIRRDPQQGLIALVQDPMSRDSEPLAVDEARLSGIWQGELLLFRRGSTASVEDAPFGLSWLMAQVMRERRLFIEIAVAATVCTLFALTPPFMFKIVLDRVLANQSMSTLKVLAGAIGFVLVFEVVLTYLRRALLEVAATRIDTRLNLFIMERIFKLPMSFFERNPTGRITAQVSKIWQVRNFVVQQLFGTLFDAVPLIGLIPALIILDWRLASLVIALALIVFVIVMLFVKPLSVRSSAVVRAEQKRSAHLVESLYGIRTIKALAIEGRRRREWDQRVAESMEARLTLGRFANLPNTLAMPFERLIYTGSFCVGAYMALTMSDAMTAGSLGAFAMLAMRVGQPLIQIAKLQMEYSEFKGALEELALVMNAPTEEGQSGTGTRQPVVGAISFKDVRFRYSNDAPYALDGISFELKPGMMLGVMGRSGSGKTTITRLLQRFNTSYDGLIKIDGIDLREIDLAHLRRSVGVVLQENFLFSGTVRDNIAASRSDASLADVIRAAQLAGAEEFIERMPRGYDTWLQEGASNLSGGQRQRLVIARALLADPPVLLFDEATSALDAESEAIVNANLRRIAQGRTVISISHRLSMLIEADAILVLERGKLYDIGTHDELLARCDIYQQLWYQQNRHIERGATSAVRAAISQGPSS